MFKIYGLVSVVVFGMAGMVILALFAWQQARDYTAALRVMRRIAIGRREPFVFSRTSSRAREAHRAA